MAKSKTKPRPTVEEALFLIEMRRKRAREVLNQILHGFTFTGIKHVNAYLLLDYLTNMIMCIEMALKLLSGDWESHNVDSMYEKVTGKKHQNNALMQSLKDAVMNQKYLLSPTAGIVDHIPELEELYVFLYRELKRIHKKYNMAIDQDFPDNFGQFLLAKVEEFYDKGSRTLRPGEDAAQVLKQMQESKSTDVERIKACLGEFLSRGHKLKLYERSGKALI